MGNADDEFLNQIEKDAVVINLKDTTEYLNKLYEEKRGVIVSNYPTINSVPIKIYKSDRSFKFNSQAFTHINSEVQPYLYQSEDYGYSRPFGINTYDDILLLNHGAYNLEISFSTDSAEGDVSQINNRKDEKIKYYRCIQPLRDSAKVPENYIHSKPFKTDKSLRFGGHIIINVDDIDIAIYNCSISEKKQIIIDTLSKITFNRFENIVETIAECFALISGSLNRDERIILGASDVNFNEINDFTFSRLDDSIINYHELINYGELSDIYSISVDERFPLEVFNSLINIAIKDRRILRVIKLITQTYDTPIEARAASLFVALETIKDVIVEEKKESISPIKNITVVKGLITKMKGLVEDVDPDEFTNKESVLRYLEGINKIGNNEGLRKIFELNGILLSKQDKDCIAMRNRFLHGTVPVKSENKKEHEKDVAFITLRTQFLVGMLLLKMSGYTGYVKNSLSFLDRVRYGNSLDEPLFRKI